MKFLAYLLVAIVSNSCLAWAQANVPESEESAYVYVATTGSDSNPGTEQAPFRTITKAVNVAIANNQQQIGTRITVEPGTYREGITLYAVSGQTSAPITVEAATPGTVTMSGSDVWTGWAAYSGNSQIFTHSWPYQWGLCEQLIPSEEDIVRRREMIFVNGAQLTQVLSLSQMVEGTFYVDEDNSTVYIWPASGTNMPTATVEVATRPSLFEVHGKTNWVLRGMTFEHANGCRQFQPAVIFTGKSSNILIDDDQFLWNNAEGVNLNSVTYVTVEDSVAEHNGEMGMVGWEAKYSLWQNDESSYNNWRGAQGAFYGVETGGGKFMSIHHGSVNGFNAFYNQSKGVHWDTDNMDVTADSLEVADNLWSGAQIEATEGPLSISNSAFCNNDIQNQRYNGGIVLLDASNVTLTDDTLLNNAQSQIYIGGRPNGIAVKNYETGVTSQVYNQNMTITSNTVEGAGPEDVFSDNYLQTGWSMFVTSLTSNYNTWWNGTTARAFMVPVPSTNTSIDFAQWESLTGQDSKSTFAAPSGNPASSCAVTPDLADFWLVVGPTSYSETTTPGGKASYTFIVVPVGFTGTVSLQASVSVTGASGAFSPASIKTSGSTTFTVSTSSDTPAGTYSVTIIASSGSLVHTVTVPLVVN